MWALLFALGARAEPSDETVVYYNARLALAEGEALESVKLWLLRNALADHTGSVSAYDPDFHSVTWASLGQLGICPDGLPPDDRGGAGLWPLAMHNWVVKNMSRKARPGRPRPFDAFDVGRQQRFVSIGDVLGGSELLEVSLYRGACLQPRVLLSLSGEPFTSKFSDRQVSGRFLLYLLDRAEETVVRERVKGLSVLDARRFDLYLQLTALSAREARTDARSKARQGRATGLSRESAQALIDDAPDYFFPPNSTPARVLRECVDWPVDEWMALTPERRRFLFLHARAYGGDPAKLDALALGVVDASILRGEGTEVEQWIGLWTQARAGRSPQEVWGSDRGARLLSLDTGSGFRERSVVALHRGVDQLGAGDLPGSLRSFAYALQRAPESTRADEVSRLARRWLSFVARQFVVDEELMVTLRELLPVRDAAVVLEDLVWSAALHADTVSFERAVKYLPSSGAVERRATLLRPLAGGDAGAFASQIRVGMKDAPSETARFLDLLLQRLELEDGDVRRAQAPTLANLEAVLRAELIRSDGRQERAIGEILDHCRAIREGVGGSANPWDRVIEGAKTMSPNEEVFVGSVRLAPSDPLPWPFVAVDVPAPSVFDPLTLTPVVWHDEAGERVLGWSVGG